MSHDFDEALKLLRSASHLTVFTGAGISVESGIPPFRGPDGLWNRVDPSFLELEQFFHQPAASWKLIKEIFYDFFGSARPNDAHLAVAYLEKAGFVKAVITQNIDNLHQEAGSVHVIEYHGTARRLVCLQCGKTWKATEVDLSVVPPFCVRCGGLLKPDFVFFGEAIPREAQLGAASEAMEADVFLVIGTTGEVMPACAMPLLARENGAKIVEVNTSPSRYTESATDVFLQGPATTVCRRLAEVLLEREWPGGG